MVPSNFPQNLMRALSMFQKSALKPDFPSQKIKFPGIYSYVYYISAMLYIIIGTEASSTTYMYWQHTKFPKNKYNSQKTKIYIEINPYGSLNFV